jgi:hypothetical protein
VPLIFLSRPIARVLVALAIIVPLIAAQIFAAKHALAATLAVSLTNSYEERKLELKSGQTAEVIVYLKSAGQTLDGYKIALVNNATRRSERLANSDLHGIVRFKGISAGSFTVLLSRPKNRVGSRSVNLGDVVLEIEKSEPSNDH